MKRIMKFLRLIVLDTSKSTVSGGTVMISYMVIIFSWELKCCNSLTSRRILFASIKSLIYVSSYCIEKREVQRMSTTSNYCISIKNGGKPENIFDFLDCNSFPCNLMFKSNIRRRLIQRKKMDIWYRIKCRSHKAVRTITTRT